MASSALWRTNSSRRRRPSGFSTRSPSMTTQLSSVPPRARPMARSASTSRRKPKVRQSASSRRNVASSIGMSISWRPMTAVGNSMAKATSKRMAGFSAARLSPSMTSTVSIISMNFRAAAWGRRPARSRIFRNGQDEPSMIGISGPSSSTVALSMPDITRAAIRCSMVATVTPAALPITVPSWVLQTASGVAGTWLSRSAMSVRTKVMPASVPAARTATWVYSPV